MSGINLSAEELSRMTPEEQAEWKALEEDTTDENLEEVVGDDEEEDEDPETEEGESIVEAEPEEGKAEVLPENEETPEEKAEVPGGIPEVLFIPKASGELLPQYQTQMDALTAKYEEGDLPIAEYLKETRKIEASSRNDETAEQLWEAEQATFFKHNPEYKPDKNRILCGALNQEVIRLANSQEAAGLSGIQILYAARDNVKKALGIAEKVDTGKQSKPQEQSKPKAKRPDIKTLGGVPAADSDSDVGVGKFAHLDKLEGLKLEQAVSKMTPAEQQEWLRG